MNPIGFTMLYEDQIGKDAYCLPEQIFPAIIYTEEPSQTILRLP